MDLTNKTTRWTLYILAFIFIIATLQAIAMFPILLVIIFFLIAYGEYDKQEPKKKDPISTRYYPDFIHISKKEKQEYLMSSKWKKIKQLRLALIDNKCELCQSKDNLELHHIHYRTWKQECFMDDVAVLCRHCHEKKHNQYGYDHNLEYPIK